MKPRTLLILLLVVAGLGAFIWAVDRDLPSSEERATRGKKLLRGVEVPEVEAVVLEWDGHLVRLERQPAPAAAAGAGADSGASVEGAGSDAETADAGDTAAGAGPPEIEAEREWRIALPADLAPARADTAAVDRLLQSVLDLDKARTVEGADPVEVGLDKPRAKITLITAGKGGAPADTVVAVGAEVPASASTLVSLDGRPEAYVVDGAFVAQLTRDPGEWRDRRAFTADRGAVERITLRRGAAGPPVVLARRGEAFWLERPIADRADRDAVDRLLGDLTGLTVERFVDQPAETQAELGLDPALATIEVELTAAGGPFRLELGAPAGDGAVEGTVAPAGGARYARAGGQLFAVQTPLGEAVDRPYADWQAKSLSAMFLYQIDRATVERGGSAGKLTLERVDSEWKRGDDKIPYTPVSELLYALTDARAERFLRPTEARRHGVDLDAPTLTVTLAGKAEAGEAGEAGETGESGKAGNAGNAGDTAARTETLRLYPPVPALGGQVPATASGRDFVLLLAKDTADKITDKLDRVEKAEPVKPEPPAPAPPDGNGT